MLNVLAIGGLLVFALAVTLQYGLKWVFPWVLLPGVVLLHPAVPVALPGLPDMTAVVAISYGCIGGLLLRGKLDFGIRWHPVDVLLLALIASHATSNYLNLSTWDFISASGNLLLDTAFPYLIARAAFADLQVRKATLVALTVMLVVLLPFTIFEWRFSPNWLSRTLEQVGLTDTANGMVLRRFGFARTLLTFQQPIDTGNSMLLLMGLMLVLLLTTGRRLADWRTWGPMALAVFIGWTSMSFTFLAAFAAAAGVLAVMHLTRPAMAVAAVLGTYVALGGLYWYMLNLPPPSDFGESTVQGSWTMRVIIVQNTWEPLLGRGPFGSGEVREQIAGLYVNSVDNAYILFVLERGLIYLGLFLAIPLVVAAYVRRAAEPLPPAARLPIYGGFAVLIGVMVGMFTVFFGFTYATLWLMVLGVTVTMCQVAQGQVAQVNLDAPRGVEPLPPSVPGAAYARAGR